MKTFERYHQAVAYIEGLSNLPLETDYMIDKNHAGRYLDRMESFLRRLGNPEKGLKIIHITGTSGKGSVTNALHNILNQAGKKVGSFTSPFATTSIEKIKIGDKFIDPEEFADIIEYMKPAIDEAYTKDRYGRPSYFEIFFALALVAFKRNRCEWAVIEVGLGGRFDATNIVKNPVVTAITTIDFDHTELLGNTLEKIAYDKAGIIKKGSAFYTTEVRPKLLRMFQKICKEQKATFTRVATKGDHKERNKLLVTTIAKHIGISSEAIEKGINKDALPCRFEKVQEKPIVIIDGAHNRSKMASTVENLKRLKFKRLFVVLSISDNKDHFSILNQIAPLADEVFFTRFETEARKCAHPKRLLSLSKGFLRKGAKTIITLDPKHALKEALSHAGTDDLVLVTGSFYLAGELRTHWISEDTILAHRTAV